MQVTITDTGTQVEVTGTWPDRKRACADGTEPSGIGPNTTVAMTCGEPGSCRWSGEAVSRIRRGDWNVALRSSFVLTGDASGRTVDESIEATRDGQPVFRRANRATVPRIST